MKRLVLILTAMITFTLGFVDISQGLDSSQGFKLLGEEEDNAFGYKVISAGDCNGDGLEDFIIFAPSASPLSRDKAGIAYVLYGKEGGFENDINMEQNFDLNQGIKIYGSARNMNAGYCLVKPCK